MADRLDSLRAGVGPKLAYLSRGKSPLASGRTSNVQHQLDSPEARLKASRLPFCRPNNLNQHARRRHGISFHLIPFRIVPSHSFFSASCSEPGSTQLSDTLPHLNAPEDTRSPSCRAPCPRPVFRSGCYSSGKRVQLCWDPWRLCLSARLVSGAARWGGTEPWAGKVAAMRSWTGHER